MSDHDDIISLEDEDEDIPDVATCQKLVEQFASITETDEACAQFYLQDHKWTLETSVNAFFEARLKSGITVLDDGDEPEVVVTFDSMLVSTQSKGTLTEEPPKNFCFITWNIDGLDEKSLKKRTKTVARIIESEKADIVFLQELVLRTYSYLENLLPQFAFIVGDREEYFTAILLRRTTVYFDGHNLIPYPNTVMGRSLLSVEAHIGDVKLHLLNTHLESTADFTKERVAQLKTGFEKMKESPSNMTTIYGGDLNMRDKEVDAVGLPSNIYDLWEACGKRPECKWTWDTERNTNKELPGLYKPKMRFDRVYMRQADPPIVTPQYFGLLGLEKTPGSQSFPSDHWGIIIRFEVIRPKDGKRKFSSVDEPSTSRETSLH